MEERIVSIPEGRVYVDEELVILEILSRLQVKNFLNNRIGSPPTGYRKQVHILGLYTRNAPSSDAQRVVAEIKAIEDETAETFSLKLDEFLSKVEEMDILIIEFVFFPTKMIIILGD